MATSDTEQMLGAFERALEGKPDYPRQLVGLAALAAAKKAPLKAFELARRAMALGETDPEIAQRARAVLSSLLRDYHVPMMNDARRNQAWDSALRRAIRPGLQVLEIGTGAGMLALMAARAGADVVTTCELDPVAAALANEVAALNGYGDRIRVVAANSRDLLLGTHLKRPADLLFCDIFADNLVGFDPLPALADARRRLLAPGAPCIPAFGAVRLALAEWRDYDCQCRIDFAAGFNLAPLRDLTTAARLLAIGDPGLVLHSTGYEAFRFDFSADSHPVSGRADLVLEAASDGIVNGIVQWIRLDLDAETFLESRPEPGAVFFSSPIFTPLSNPRHFARGERHKVVAEYTGKNLMLLA